MDRCRFRADPASPQGRFITHRRSFYASAAAPACRVGQQVALRWVGAGNSAALCGAQVLSVSDRPNGGLLFRKFTYTIRILECPDPRLIGSVETGVAENCLITNP